MKYKITFQDGKTFLGNSFDGSWNKMPNKVIKRLEYIFRSNKLIMKGYEAYNHSYTQYVFQNGLKKITGLYLMGKVKNKIEVFYYDFKLNKAFKYLALYGKELKSPIYQNDSIIGWGQEQPIQGWHRGELNIPEMLKEKINPFLRY